MAATLTHETPARTVLSDAMLAYIDGGANPGALVFETSADGEVATITFAATSGTSATGVITFSGWTNDTSATGGTVEHGSIYRDNAGTPIKVLEGNAGTTDESFILSSLSIGAGDTVTLSSLTWTAPA